jgi:hypothetical protein
MSDVAPVQQVETVFEVDTVHSSDFGTMYRLWQGWNLLGTFYYSDKDNTWVTQPSCSNRESHCDSPDQAQMLIVAVSGLLVEGAK